ncbi:MAG: hypothetical protein ACJAS1_005562, partial [Oleiphilaceae bacterium]
MTLPRNKPSLKTQINDLAHWLPSITPPTGLLRGLATGRTIYQKKNHP